MLYYNSLLARICCQKKVFCQFCHRIKKLNSCILLNSVVYAFFRFWKLTNQKSKIKFIYNLVMKRV